ncbi:MAG: DUF3883 domain-containing protein [Oscillospiraceae bacterium]|nr:DUF3883 domain-containing protein [Oscillospiraceae bacterium]
MYNHENQYRCTIVRGKSQSEMDDLLPLYAKIIDSICPCDVKNFKSAFDNAIRPFLKAKEKDRKDPTQKTLDNHRTENAGTLFGMYYTADDGKVYVSKRTLKFLSDSDTPAFFKDICYKMQFPNECQKWQYLKDRIYNKINVRQFPFLLKVMLLAKSNNITLTSREIGYYILNSLDVLQGIANPLEVYDAIITDRNNSIERDIIVPDKERSYNWQHIMEQINLLEFANLVIIDKDEVSLNPNETRVIELFAKEYNRKPIFDVYSYDLSTVSDRKQFFSEWEEYFSALSDKEKLFDTTAEALGVTIEVSGEEASEHGQTSTVEIGDEGERYVYEYEKRRVSAFNFRLAGKVVHLGKTRGLGYDIQSVVAETGDNAEFVKYIEVKATKRVTAPDLTKSDWIDTLNITRNEWVAAQQWGRSYSIYRVYFIRNAVVMFVFTDIAQKCSDNVITAVPMTYRIDFNNNAVDREIRELAGGVVDV